MRETRIGTVTLTKDSADRFFLSMQLASDEPFVRSQKADHGHIGIDLNTDNFLTDSEGNIVPNPRYYRTIKGKLAKEQRILSRRQRRAKKEHRFLRDSKNYQKQRLLVAKLHAKVMNQRHNFLHQVSTALIKNHDLVVAEELRSKNMLKIMLWRLAFLTLAGVLFSACWLIKQICMVVNLSRSAQNTTQTCHDCGFVMGINGTVKLTLADRKWTCPNCGTHHIRDWNAAKNILDKGIAKLA